MEPETELREVARMLERLNALKRTHAVQNAILEIIEQEHPKIYREALIRVAKRRTP